MTVLIAIAAIEAAHTAWCYYRDRRHTRRAGPD
jgi:hypothetical protein